jgi:hypothetical protein
LPEVRKLRDSGANIVRVRRRCLRIAYYGIPFGSEPSAEAKLAAAVLRSGLRDARAGRVDDRDWITTPRRLEPWARLLRVKPERLADLARDALRRPLEDRDTD